MPGTRLSTIAPDLAVVLEQQSDEACERIVRSVLRRLLDDARLAGAVERAATAVAAGEPVPESLRDEVEAEVDRLDEIAWDLQDQAEAGEVEEADYLRAFRTARAAGGVWSALETDRRAACLETVYEVRAATEDPAELDSFVRSLLDPHR